MNITYWNTLSLTIQLSAHSCGSVSPSEGTGNVWFLIWWSKEPKVKDKGHSSRVPQRHWTAEPQEPDQFMSLLYPWRPQDCRGWDAGVCHTVLSPCRHRWQEDKAQLAGRALQGSVLALLEVTGHCETAEPRQSHTLTWWKWPNTANGSAPALCNLLIPLTNNSPLSLDGETTAVSARAEPRPLCAHGCFFPGDSQFLALVALG